MHQNLRWASREPWTRSREYGRLLTFITKFDIGLNKQKQEPSIISLQV